MKITATTTELSVDNGIFHYNEKFEEDNSFLLEKAKIYLDELFSFEESEGVPYDYGDTWNKCDERAVRESVGLFLILEDKTIYQWIRSVIF